LNGGFWFGNGQADIMTSRKAAAASRRASNSRKAEDEAYVLDSQVGFILRQVSQRHAVIFDELIGEGITPMQWAALAKLQEIGPTSQNLLGRLTSMDAATVKGVVLRLARRHLVETSPDPEDGRRLVVRLTEQGRRIVKKLTPRAAAISQVTLAPLTQEEQTRLIALLTKLR
jgi:MarR family transcriptional regulator, lower aerobic nicotinate degradation pathway regulator